MTEARLSFIYDLWLVLFGWFIKFSTLLKYKFPFYARFYNFSWSIYDQGALFLVFPSALYNSFCFRAFFQRLP